MNLNVVYNRIKLDYLSFFAFSKNVGICVGWPAYH